MTLIFFERIIIESTLLPQVTQCSREGYIYNSTKKIRRWPIITIEYHDKFLCGKKNANKEFTRSLSQLTIYIEKKKANIDQYYMIINVDQSVCFIEFQVTNVIMRKKKIG